MVYLDESGILVLNIQMATVIYVTERLSEKSLA